MVHWCEDNNQRELFSTFKNLVRWSYDTEQQDGEDEGIHGLYEVFSDLRYRNAMENEQLSNYPNENDMQSWNQLLMKRLFKDNGYIC